MRIINLVSKHPNNSRKNMKKIVFLMLVASFSITKINAQVQVDVNLNVKHIVGDKSEFDRNKYITLPIFKF
ncbi:hypothetical protein [Polaribacter sp. M15]